jgi:hypothetical protein
VLISLLLALAGVAMVVVSCIIAPALVLFGGGVALLLVGILRDEGGESE